MEPQGPRGPLAGRLQRSGPDTAPVSIEPQVRDAQQGPSGQPTTSTARSPSEPTVASEPIAALRGVSRTFDDVDALRDVDLDIPRGSIVGMIGPSGAGKTTAIRLLTGALRPSDGTVEVLGQDPTRLPSGTRARIGFMPQHVSLYDDLTVTENLDFVASLYGLFMFRRRRRIGALLDWLELGDARKRRAGDLSGGMRRRLQLACALVHDPELVFLDEPTAGIDPLVRQSIWRELHRLREAGRTLLITTQYVPEAEECDAVALIAEGRLIAFASPEELRRRAFGGQLLEVETSDAVDADRLQADVAVEEVRRIGPRRVQVLSQDAATATPAVIAGVEAQGSSVTSIHEARPSFDEVFALLVRGSQPEETGAPAEASSEEPAAHEAALAPLPPADGAGDDRDLPPADDDDEAGPPAQDPKASTEPEPQVVVR